MIRLPDPKPDVIARRDEIVAALRAGDPAWAAAVMTAHIHNARAKVPGVSRVLCIDCDAPIPSARRRAIPGVQCCVTCQEIAELKGKHYVGGAV